MTGDVGCEILSVYVPGCGVSPVTSAAPVFEHRWVRFCLPAMG